MGEAGHRVPEVCRAVGISYRQLDYWARTGLLEPSLQPGTGSGTQRLYSDADLKRGQAIRCLLDAGVALQEIRRAIDLAGGFPGLALLIERQEHQLHRLRGILAELAFLDALEAVPA